MREMTRRCSHCSHNGHNSRTCPNRGVKIFGVRLTDGSIRKSASMGNLSLYAGSSGGGSPADGAPDHGGGGGGGGGDGYVSEDFAHGNASSSRERKKGVPWTEEEHRMFLLGLKKLGKGDWRGIARNYVVSRTPTQVASHAQKYFIRQTNASRRKRRSSLFDMIPDDPVNEQLFPIAPQEPEAHGNNQPPAPAVDEECESMDSNTMMDSSPNDAIAVPNPELVHCNYPIFYPAFVAPIYPFSMPVWPGYCAEPVENMSHKVVKPTATHPKAPINVDELGGMSKLTLGESINDAKPSFLSLKLPDGSDRQSAFHAKPPASGSTVSSSTNAIPAV